MIEGVKSINPNMVRIKNFLPRNREKANDTTISPAYKNDISKFESDCVKFEAISFNNPNAISSIESELNDTFYERMPGTDIYNDRSTDLYIYDVGDLADDMGLSLRSTKVVSQLDYQGGRSYKIFLANGDTSTIQLSVPNATAKFADQPIDESTLKNVVLKALKMNIDTQEAVSKVSNSKLSGDFIQFDPSTKQANFDDFEKRNQSFIKSIYKRFNLITDFEVEKYKKELLLNMTEIV